MAKGAGTTRSVNSGNAASMRSLTPSVSAYSGMRETLDNLLSEVRYSPTSDEQWKRFENLMDSRRTAIEQFRGEKFSDTEWAEYITKRKFTVNSPTGVLEVDNNDYYIKVYKDNFAPNLRIPGVAVQVSTLREPRSFRRRNRRGQRAGARRDR